MSQEIRSSVRAIIILQNIYNQKKQQFKMCVLFYSRLGGPDPLDYISMYSNPGDSSNGILPHWHYITFGLSDLHGDGRVHE